MRTLAGLFIWEVERMNRGLKVPGWLKNAIEDELRRYQITKIMIREVKQDIVDSAPVRPQPEYMTKGVLDALKERAFPASITLRTDKTDPGPALSNNHVSDPTFAKVVRLTSRDILQMEWVFRAITDIYQIASPECRKVMELYYWKGHRHFEVADAMGMSEPTLWRMRQVIIHDVALRMGALRPDWSWLRKAQDKPPKQRERILKGSEPKTGL